MNVLDDCARVFGGEPIFRPRTVWTLVIFYVIAGVGLFLIHLAKRTALIEPTAPIFHSSMIALGAFVGVFLAAVVRDAWTMGFGFGRPVPEGFSALLQLVALVGASSVSGGFVADLLVEGASFGCFDAATRRETVEVIEHHRALRSSDWLDLKARSGSIFSVNCGFDACRGVPRGSRVEITVQIGRNGVERAIVPPRLRDHIVGG